MSKTINRIVWDVFIEETMGQDKAELYCDRLKDYAEDMCYITYANIIRETNKGTPIELIKFDDVLPKDLIQSNGEGG